MKLVDQWRSIEDGLPDGWEDVRLTLTAEQPSDLDRAAQILGPMNVGRVGSELVVHVQRAGGAKGPEAARRLFAMLDASRVWCVLGEPLVQAAETTSGAPAAEAVAVPVAESWDAALAPLPPDVSDLLCELELSSSDHLNRAALLCAPINPTRDPSRLAFVFRCSGALGYGVSRGMARRCFERLDAEGIPGSVRIVRTLSSLDNVATQGAVWLVGGRVL